MAAARYAVHASSVLAVVGLLSLLLADSAEPTCESTLFERTFDVTTTCKGDHSGRIRVKRELSMYVGNGSTDSGSSSFLREDVQRLSGDIDVQGGYALGSCSEEDEPIVFTGITLTVAAAPKDAATGNGVERADCMVDFSSDLGKDVPCTTPDFPITDCTLRLTAVP
jgi:hypothetical protein